MARGKYEVPRKRINPIMWVILAFAVLSAVSGGVSAYLSASSDSVSNEFSVAEHPTVTVNPNGSITVTDPGYAVYLRAAVVVNWTSTTNGNILATAPVENVDYTLELNGDWKQIGDFYYYLRKIQTDVTSTPIIKLTPKATKNGYELTITVVAQTIQAVGQTDGPSPVDAVYDAWGVTADQITTP